MTPDVLNILLVEDNRPQAIMVQEYLQKARPGAFHLTWVNRLRKAIDALTQSTYHAALLDLTLPDSNGLETLDALQTQCPTLPVIVTTDIQDEEIAIGAIRRGAQDYLVKDDLSGRAIARAIQYAIDRKQIERRLRNSEARFSLLSHTAGQLLAADDPQSVVDDLCRRVMTHLDCQVFFNYMVTHDAPVTGQAAANTPRGSDATRPTDALVLNACAGIPEGEERRIARLDFGEAVSGCVARDGVPIVIAEIDASSDPRTKLGKLFGVQAYCCHPLIAQGQTIGTLSFGTTTRTAFSDEDVALMKTVADQVAIAMQHLATKRAIERAKNEWEHTFDSVPDLIAIFDRHHRVVRVNRAMAARLNRTPAECVGLTCYETIHGGSAPIAACPHALTLIDGKGHSAEIHEERLAGDFMVTTSPLKTADGQIAGSVHVARDITEQKAAERREQEALAIMTASRTAVDILDAMGEGVMLLDMSGRIRSINPALEQMSGISAGEVAGRPVANLLSELLLPEEHRLAAEALKKARQGIAPTLPTITLLSRSGRRIPLIPSVTLIRGTNNRPTGIVVTLRDISKLRAVQLLLEESNELLERIFDNTYMSIVYLDPDFNFVRVNRAYADSCGKTPDFFPGKNHFSLYPHAENEAIFRQVVRTGQPFSIHEKPFEFPDHPEWGVTYWDWTLQPLRGEGAAPVDGLLFCLLDVTQRVKARERLVESERKYRELVENANSIIVRMTPDLTITFFNEYAQSFFGYAPDEIIGRNALGTIVPETDSEGRDLRQMAHEVAIEPELHAENENENMRKDGRRVWVYWANRAIRDERGRLVELLCVGTDISRRRELEKQAHRYQERLRSLAEKLAANEEQDRWQISRYIHDTIIQNLSLSSIKLGSMEAPLAEGRFHKEVETLGTARRLIGDAISECRTVMSDLTPSLLYDLGLVPALHDLAETINSQHKVEVHVREEGDPASISPALLGLLFQSTRELVMNALKHAGPTDIHISVLHGERDLTVQVQDIGRGFDPTHLNRHDSGNTGFGLFSVRERVEGLGGRLDILSAPGRGTTTRIVVPIHPAEE